MANLYRILFLSLLSTVSSATLFPDEGVRVVPIASNHARFRRSARRPGSATNTDSCSHVRPVPHAVKAQLSLSNYYQKYTEAYGIPIIGSRNVPDRAVHRACYVTKFLFADRYDARNSYYRNKGRMAIMGQHEYTTMIPEHSFLPAWWNQRARGLGATMHVPCASCAEENLLCYKSDKYISEDITLHEFAHGFHLVGLKQADRGFQSRLVAAHQNAQRRGLWPRTYAISNVDEYFAEGVQSYFDVNAYASPANGVHNDINTRAKLRSYDPTLYGILQQAFPCGNTYIKRCDPQSSTKILAQNLKINCNGGGGGGGGTVVRPPRPPVGGCVDNDVNCPTWAKHGYCESSKETMLVICRKSCKVC